MPSALKKVKR